MTEFIVKPMPMICASHEAEVRKYRKYECAAGVYLVAVQDACADNVYFHNPKDKNSDGFGGRTIEFPLEDGTIYSAKGPWKCAASYLKKNAGIDIEDKYSSFVVIGKGVRFEPGCYEHKRIITDVVHQDDGWKIGRFDREKEIVRALPPGEYQYYRETAGGSSAGRIVNPNDVMDTRS